MNLLLTAPLNPDLTPTLSKGEGERGGLTEHLFMMYSL